MSEELKPLDDGKCAKCGAGTDSLLLAEDHTKYTGVYRDEHNKLQRNGDGSLEPTGVEESVRLFCTECGQGHLVPEELE